MRQLDTIKLFVEQKAFGVCTWLGSKMGIKTERVRLYFLYATFGTLGSSVILYLILAFWLNVKNYQKEGRRTVWDL
jgi:phage shock protein PspC (stress-responsive transcriptional regulator)